MAMQVEIGDFEVIRTLGHGSFGRVEFAKYKPDGKCYAVKLMKKHAVIKLKKVGQINDERRVMAQIDYPFIVSLMGFAKDAHYVYMVMECITGGELFTHLRRAQFFSDEQSKFYAAQMGAALAHMHSKNIIHRNLDSETVFLMPNGYSKLGGFGFTKFLEPGTRTYTLSAEPGRIAPEMLLAKGHGKPVDWWMLGFLIYEMVVGQPPFWDDNPIRIYEKILAGKASYPKYFDKNAKALVKNLLTPDLRKRYGNLKGGANDILLHEWFATLDFERLEKYEIPAPYKPAMKDELDVSNFENWWVSDELAPTVTASQDPFVSW